MTMDDYLKSGGVNRNLDVLNPNEGTKFGRSPTFTRKEELYLSGYGRQWGEKLTYSAGLAYGTGMFVGGSYGLVHGIRKGGATRRLFMNTVLNSCATHGPFLANQCAAITMFYCGFNNIVGWTCGAEQPMNAPIAGALAGGLFKIAGSWRAKATYSVASAVIFTGISFASRQGYL